MRAEVLADVAANYATGRDFSTQSLPDNRGTGSWKYYEVANGQNPGTSNLTVLTASNSLENGGNPGYNGDELIFGAFLLPAVSAKNIFGDGATPPAGSLAWHAGQTHDAVLQWTAGAGESGLLTVSGNVSKANEPGGDIDYRIYVNDVQRASSGAAFASGTSNYSFITPILAGDTVSFVLDVNGSVSGDEATVMAQISTPEPGSLALIGVGAAGLLGRRRRRL